MSILFDRLLSSLDAILSEPDLLGQSYSQLNMATFNNSLNLSQLLESGKYSDMTLECQGHKFRVHKMVVCSQSPVLAAAMDGNFQVLENSPRERVHDTDIGLGVWDWRRQCQAVQLRDCPSNGGVSLLW